MILKLAFQVFKRREKVFILVKKQWDKWKLSFESKTALTANKLANRFLGDSKML